MMKLRLIKVKNKLDFMDDNLTDKIIDLKQDKNSYKLNENELSAINKGLEDISAGKTYTSIEIEHELDLWLNNNLVR